MSTISMTIWWHHVYVHVHHNHFHVHVHVRHVHDHHFFLWVDWPSGPMWLEDTRLLSSLPYPTLLEIKKPLLARGPLTSKIAGSSQNVLVIAFVFVCCVSNGLVPHQWSNAQKITYLNVCSLRVFAKCLCLCHCLCLYICLFLCHWSCVLIHSDQISHEISLKGCLGTNKNYNKILQRPLPPAGSPKQFKPQISCDWRDAESWFL